MKFYLTAALLLMIAPAMVATVRPTEAKDHVGQSVTVEGIASVHTIASGMTFINLGGKGRNAPFTGVIFKDKASAFPNVQSYDGKTVDVTGTVKSYKGAAEIALDSPSQISAK